MLTNINKSIYRNLLSIYGLGETKAKSICETLGVSLNTKLADISTNKKDALNAIITNLKKNAPGIELELKINNMNNITRLISTNSYRGKRHKANLPTRGQRTRTNAKTVKKIKAIFKL